MTQGKQKRSILVCDTEGRGRADEYYEKVMQALRQERLEDSVQVVRARELGFFGAGMAMMILPDQITYADINDEKLARIIAETVKKNTPVAALVRTQPAKQMRVVLRNCGTIDPESIDDYMQYDGYQAVRKILAEYTPEQVLAELKESGLRGRGGGGFPTAAKWGFAYRTKADAKFIICNADEGDPGAYMDRSVLEGDPHSVIEGMIIGGYTIGASKGYFYVRAEYPLAITRVQRALEQARAYGLLGEKVLGTDFNFDIEIRLGAGAFVCGEETALIASIEGKRGCPSPRPPYPSVSGLWGKPTVINNVETLANIPAIFVRGAAWFAGIGSATSKGTKVFALTGKVKNSGLIEVPMGMTLREIVYEVGGGVLANKQLKAVQTGGPSGGVIPVAFLDTPVDYENLQKLGSIMGSGGMIVMDEDDCMVDIAKFYLRFCVDESCGKCAPCRIGGYQMLSYLQKISRGTATSDDIGKLQQICVATQRASLCGLGQTAPNPVLSTLKYFREEYDEHIENKRCRAKKCVELISYRIVTEKCVRCGMCARACPVNAIAKQKDGSYRIDQAACVKCGKCFQICKFNAIVQE